MKNEVMETIFSRRSVRSYEPKPVPEDVLTTIIEAGNRAPARGILDKTTGQQHFQPWRFIVVEDPELKKKLREVTYPVWKTKMEEIREAAPETYEHVMAQYEQMPEPKDIVYYNAPAIVFVIGPKGYQISCALACENMMIAATSLGLGSCYVGFGAMVSHDKEMVKTLGIEDDERIYGPILIGFPKEDSNEIANFLPEKRDPVVKWL